MLFPLKSLTVFLLRSFTVRRAMYSDGEADEENSGKENERSGGEESE